MTYVRSEAERAQSELMARVQADMGLDFANELGNANYLPAFQVVQTFTVNKAATTLVATPQGLLFTTLSAIFTRSFDGAPIGGQTVVFRSGSMTICTAVTNANGVASCSVTLGVSLFGTYTATYAGNADYLPGTGGAPL